MSAPVTEAHRATAHRVNRAETNEEGAEAIADSEARVVAAAVVTLEARITSDEELFHDIRMKLTAACGDPYKLHDEALDAIITERDRLRAEVERLKSDGAASVFVNMSCRASRAETERNNLRADLDAIKAILTEEKGRAERAEASLHALNLVCGTTDADKFSTWVDRANTRAEKAEAELDAERARMADLVADLNDACITLDSAKNDCDDYAMQNTAFKLMAVRAVLLQYIPVAAMKEETK